MSYKKGVVEFISLKEVKEGQYGKFAPYSLKIGEEWFSGLANEDKYKKVVVVKDSNHNEVLQGMEVEFMYDVNDKYNNIDKKTLKVLASGSAVQQPVQSPVQPTPVKQQSADKSYEVALLDTSAKMASLVFRDIAVPIDIEDKLKRMVLVLTHKATAFNIGIGLYLSALDCALNVLELTYRDSEIPKDISEIIFSKAEGLL